MHFNINTSILRYPYEKHTHTHTLSLTHCLSPSNLLKNRTYNFDCFATIFWPFPSHDTASPTISSTISLALFLSLTTAAALPMRNGRALSMVSSSMSSPSVSKSCSTGIVPLEVRSLISCARFSSQF